MPEHTEFELRRERLSALLPETRARAFIVTALPNVQYLSGFTGSNGALLLTPDRALLFTDPRYEIQATQESDCEVRIAKSQLPNDLSSWIKRLRLKSVAFERTRISFEDHAHLKKLAPDVRLRPAAGLVESLRMVKSPAEIAAIKVSVQLNSSAFAQALRHFKNNMTEADLAAEVEYRMRRLGAEGPAFETIIASGPRTALPHARPTSSPIHKNELLLMDMGAKVAGYASDMTRTLVVGRLDSNRRRMYRAVLESQLAAVDTVRPGVSCSTVDRAARDVLRGFGLEHLFVHSTGHGLGLEIHERPRLGRKERTKLETGMVVTIEPGVYQEGFGGIRIEDTIVVTARGCDVLTPTGKQLISL